MSQSILSYEDAVQAEVCGRVLPDTSGAFASETFRALILALCESRQNENSMVRTLTTIGEV